MVAWFFHKGLHLYSLEFLPVSCFAYVVTEAPAVNGTLNTGQNVSPVAAAAVG